MWNWRHQFQLGCVKIVNTRQTFLTASYCLWTNPNFPSLRRRGIRTRLLQKRVQSLFFSRLPQFPLGSFACSSLTELVFMIRSPPWLTEKEQLAVYFSKRRRQPEVNFSSGQRFPPTWSAVGTRRRLCFAFFDVACKTWVSFFIILVFLWHFAFKFCTNRGLSYNLSFLNERLYRKDGLFSWFARPLDWLKRNS